jgi:hypothetical protein
MTLFEKLFGRKTVFVPFDGAMAYDEGYQLSDNPYRQHTPDHSIWRDDYLFASQFPRMKNAKSS